MLPYAKSTQVYTCPTDPGRPGVPNGVGKIFTYRMNTNLHSDNNSSGGRGAQFLVHLAAIAAPTEIVGIYEVTGGDYALVDQEPDSPVGNGNGTGGGSTHGPCGTVATNCSNMQPTQRTNGTLRHLEGSNYLFLDGHVKWYVPDNVSFGYRARAAGNAEGVGDGSPSASHYAQSTEYSGSNAKQVTFSTK